MRARQPNPVRASAAAFSAATSAITNGSVLRRRDLLGASPADSFSPFAAAMPDSISGVSLSFAIRSSSSDNTLGLPFSDQPHDASPHHRTPRVAVPLGVAGDLRIRAQLE